ARFSVTDRVADARRRGRRRRDGAARELGAEDAAVPARRTEIDRLEREIGPCALLHDRLLQDRRFETRLPVADGAGEALLGRGRRRRRDGAARELGAEDAAVPAPRAEIERLEREIGPCALLHGLLLQDRRIEARLPVADGAVEALLGRRRRGR